MQAGVFKEAMLDQAGWKEFFKPVIILDCIHFQLSKGFSIYKLHCMPVSAQNHFQPGILVYI